MSIIDTETKRKLREMGVTALADAFETQDDLLVGGMPFAERVGLIVDDAHASFTSQKIDGLTRRAQLRYPDAELRRLDLLEKRGIDRGVIANLATCTFIGRCENVVFQGFTGSGKTYLGSALARAACQHRYRALYVRMPDLEEAWLASADKPGGKEKFLRKAKLAATIRGDADAQRSDLQNLQEFSRPPARPSIRLPLTPQP